MGKDIHYSIIRFLEDRLKQHSKVLYFERVDSDKDIIYQVTRTLDLPALHIHMSDAYVYTEHSYLSRPSLIGEGDFILIAKPEASFDGSEFSTSRHDKIGFGKIGALLGALNYRNVWEYETPYEREEKRKRKDKPELF